MKTTEMVSAGFRVMAANTNHEEEWLQQPVEESPQFSKDCSELVLGQVSTPPGDHCLICYYYFKM